MYNICSVYEKILLECEYEIHKKSYIYSFITSRKAEKKQTSFKKRWQYTTVKVGQTLSDSSHEFKVDYGK